MKRWLRTLGRLGAPEPAEAEEFGIEQRQRPGIPVRKPAELLEVFHEEVNRVAKFVGCDRSEFEQILVPAIKAYAAYVHLLPASEAHHHRETGGLLRHGLETAASAGARASQTIFVHYRTSTPHQRREEEPRWRIAAVVGGLMHDASKAASDVVVVAGDGKAEGESWNPFADDLYTWLARNRVGRYHIHWQADRNGRHERLSAFLFSQIPRETQAYLAASGPHIPEALAEVFSGQAAQTNLLPGIISGADRDSVDADLKTRAGTGGADGAGREPIEDTLMQLIRDLVRETWTFNAKGARMFRLDADGIYLVWPAAGEEIVTRARKLGLPGVPSDPRTLSEILVSRGKARAWREDSLLWPIIPEGVKLPEGGLLWALRIAPAERLSDPPPVHPGRAGEEAIVEEADSPAPATEPAPDPMDAVDGDSAGADKPPTAVPDAPPAEPRAASEETSPPTEPVAETPAPPREEPLAETPAEPKAEAESDSADASGVEAVELETMGFLGAALAGFRDDLAEGEVRKWGEHAQVINGGRVALRHPDALKGYGEGTRELLSELSRLDAIEPDPDQPQRLVREAGTFSKALVLKPAVSASLMTSDAAQVAEGASAASSRPEEPTAPAPQPELKPEPESPPDVEPDEAPPTEPVHTPEPSAVPQPPTDPRAVPEAQDDTDDEQLQKVMASLPSDIKVQDLGEGRVGTSFSRTLTRLYHETGVSKWQLHQLVARATQAERLEEGREALLAFPADWLPDRNGRAG